MKIGHVGIGMDICIGDFPYQHFIGSIEGASKPRETAHLVLICVVAQIIKMA